MCSSDLNTRRIKILTARILFKVISPFHTCCYPVYESRNRFMTVDCFSRGGWLGPLCSAALCELERTAEPSGPSQANRPVRMRRTRRLRCPIHSIRAQSTEAQTTRPVKSNGGRFFSRFVSRFYLTRFLNYGSLILCD